MYTKRLNNSKDLSDMGNKCGNLAILTEFGFNVPLAYGVTFNSFKQFIKPFVTQIQAIIQLNDYKTASEKIREFIINSPVPKEVITSIEKSVLDFSPNTKFAVRSSGTVLKNGEAIVEDSAKKSLAGQFESFLNVPPSEVLNAVKLCWASLFNERSLHVFEAKTNCSFLESKMSVVVQQMVLADVSAVMMTQDPLEVDPLLAFEATYGACEAIVSGKVTGDLITIDRNSMIVINRELGSKRNTVIYDVFNGNNRGTYNLEPTSDEMRKNFSVDNKTALRIAKVGLEIEKKFGHPQDIELVIADQEIFIVQTRNITTNIH
jgi:phosphoenolpyruvate synthase/pyruvate phosphate dikinase